MSRLLLLSETQMSDRDTSQFLRSLSAYNVRRNPEVDVWTQQEINLDTQIFL